MKLVVQRVKSARVTLPEEGDRQVGAIGPGYLVLFGVAADDLDCDIPYLVSKLLTARLFDGEPAAEGGEARPWACTVQDKGFEILVVSQFTLYAHFKGAKPDFHFSMDNERARHYYEEFLRQLRAKYVPERVQTGQFGCEMDVSLCNWGPCTVEIDSRVWKYLEGVEQFSKVGGIKAQRAWEKAYGVGKAVGAGAGGAATPSVDSVSATSPSQGVQNPKLMSKRAQKRLARAGEAAGAPVEAPAGAPPAEVVEVAEECAPRPAGASLAPDGSSIPV